MNATRLAGAGLVVIAAVGVAASPNALQQTPSFRARAELVSVDVLVRLANTPVSGLTSADFDLRDDGVRQQIDAISAGSVPVDLTLIIDVSGSTTSLIDQFKNDVRQIVKMLRPEDRVRLLTFETDVHEVFSLRPAGGSLPLDRLRPGRSTALNDGLLLALMHAPDPERRHLMVAFTDGDENSSVIDAPTLTDAAKHADGILHVVLADSTPAIRMPGSLLSAITMRRAGQLATLRAIAEATGGEVHASESAKHIVEDFKPVFDSFRGSYVLRYTPRGVTSSGWHDITVTLMKPGAYQIQARKGYFGG